MQRLVVSALIALAPAAFAVDAKPVAARPAASTAPVPAKATPRSASGVDGMKWDRLERRPVTPATVPDASTRSGLPKGTPPEIDKTRR